MTARTASKGAKKPTMEVVTITPQMAEEMLTRNTKNRDIRQRKLDQYCGALRRGEWELNGEAIKITTEGDVADGQHRLWAIVMTEIPMETCVITGVRQSTQRTMDLGAPRNLKDSLKIDGYTNASRLAATIAYYWKILNGVVRDGSAKPTLQQGYEVLKGNPELASACIMGDRVRQRFHMSTAMISAVYYQLVSVGAEEADVFINNLLSGVGLQENDPIYVLRKYLERQSALGAAARANALLTHALIVKAWNSWRRGEQIQKLTWRASGNNPEPFPEPV